MTRKSVNPLSSLRGRGSNPATSPSAEISALETENEKLHSELTNKQAEVTKLQQSVVDPEEYINEPAGLEGLDMTNGQLMQHIYGRFNMWMENRHQDERDMISLIKLCRIIPRLLPFPDDVRAMAKMADEADGIESQPGFDPLPDELVTQIDESDIPDV